MAALTPEMRPYHPRGRALEVLYAKDDELIVSGPAGTGKSRAILEKLHICAEKYPGMRGLIVRKTRASLTESALVTWEDKVAPVGHPMLSGPQRRNRQAYRYPNGSEIIVGGLDKASRIMSTEFDLIYPQEAIELDENDWEALTTRLRNGVMPYQQILGDTNPDKPAHWLYQRVQKGLCRLIDSRHEDNPTLFEEAPPGTPRSDEWPLLAYDGRVGRWTGPGATYIDKLDRLTGARHARLRHGKWVAAEGQVYEEYEASIHLIDRFTPPPDWKRLWVVDFGFTAPFVWQEWVEDPDGRLFRHLEIYSTGRLVEDHARQILSVTSGQPEPEAIICDHDAEDRATLERHLGMPTVAAHKSISDGIQAVKSRFRRAGDGKPRIYFMRDSLIERDEKLLDEKKPTCTEEEIDGYVWPADKPKANSNPKKGEVPVKKDDHGMDTMRYLVAHRDLKRVMKAARAYQG